MKNLKRILSLALASVMVMGMMVVGASAAFDDQDKMNPINVDAVNTMNALGVINGKGNGIFDPTGDVTRAEMATMIAMALNGGNANYRGTTTTGFTDVDGHSDLSWAAKHIKYCVDQGILSGVGGNKFNPNANVTAQEAATMILIAMGYKKEMLKSETSDWAAKINLTAEQRDLYDDTKVTDYTQAIDRETAAQMLFNGITAYAPKITDTYNATTGEHLYNVEGLTTSSILSSAFKAKMEYAVMSKIEVNDDDTITYTLDGARGLEAGPKFDNGTSDTLTCEADYSELFQRQVKVIYSGTPGAAKGAIVIGMTAAGDDILSEGALGLLDTRSGKLDGKGVDAASNGDVPYYNFMDDTQHAGLVAHMGPAANKIHTYQLIDQDLNGKVDYAVVTPLSVAKVTFVGRDSISVNDGSRTDAYKFKAADIYSGVSRGDYVTIVDGDNTLSGAPVIRKLEPVTGTLTNENSADNSFKMNGEWLTVLTGGPDSLSVAAGTATFAVGDEVEVYTIGNYVVAGGPVGESSTTTLGNILYVAATDNAATAPTAGKEIPKTFAGKNPGIDTSVIFTDGTSQIVKTMRVDTWLHTEDITDDTLIYTAANKKASVPAPGLYSYSVNDDGVYELKAIKAATSHAVVLDTAATGKDMYVANAANLPSGISLDAGTGLTDAWDKNTGKIKGSSTNTYFVADDAVVILVKTGDNKFDVISGKELKATSKWGTATTVLYKNVSGLGTAQMILVTSTANLPTVDGTTQYGYITSAGVGELNGNKYNIRFTVWTEDGEQELVAVAGVANASLSNTDLGSFAKGTFVTFKTTTTAGQVTDVAAVAATTEVAIKGFDDPTNPETIRIDTSALGTGSDEYVTIDEKTVVLFINTADKKGVEGATLVEAFEVANGVYTKNAIIKVDSTDDTVDVILVDTNNSLAGATYSIAAPTAWAPTAPATDVNGISAIANNGTATSGKAGSTVALKLTVTGATAAGKQTKITATFTCADGTTFTASKTLPAETAAGAQEINFSMPAQPITGITLAVTDVTPAP